MQEANSRLFLGSGASICQSRSGRFLLHSARKSLTWCEWEPEKEPKWKKQRLPGYNTLLWWGLPCSEVINWDPELRTEQTLEQWQSHQTPSHGTFVKKSRISATGSHFARSYNFLKNLDNGIKRMIFMGRELLPVQASSLDFVARLGSPSWSGLRFLSSFISSIHPTFVVAPSIQATWTAIQVCFSRCLESPACPHTTWRQLASSTASSSGSLLKCQSL